MIILSGCSYTSSRGNYSIGAGTVELNSASVTIKIVGDSKNTQISYFVTEEEDEDKEKAEEDYTINSTNAPASAIENEFEKNKRTFELPWSKEIPLQGDEILYLQVKPIDFNEKITVEIWKYGLLDKTYTITNKLFPFWTSYRI
ncbi:MAG: hypothetical protein ABIA59_03175 [Candidatus Latescibacterota bacterium]